MPCPALISGPHATTLSASAAYGAAREHRADAAAALAMARATARQLSRDPVEQDDLVGAALLGLLEHARRRPTSVDDAVGEPSWFLLRARAIDRWRRKRAHDAAVVRSSALEPEVGFDSAPLRRRVDLQRLLGRADLSEDDALVLQVIYREGDGFRALARRAGWSEATARRRHARLLARLREVRGEVREEVREEVRGEVRGEA